MSTKSDSDVILCLQMLSKTLTCTLELTRIDSSLVYYPILMIGLIHIDYYTGFFYPSPDLARKDLISQSPKGEG